jgi:hypothetical protein
VKPEGELALSGLRLTPLEVCQRFDDLIAEVLWGPKLTPHSALGCSGFQLLQFFWAAFVFSTSFGGTGKSSRIRNTKIGMPRPIAGSNSSSVIASF